MEGLKSKSSSNKIYLRIKGIKEKDPHFLWQKDKEGKDVERFEQIEGYFKSVEFKTIPRTDEKGEHESRVFNLSLMSTDGYEYVIGCGFTQIGRSILNTLISKPSHGKLRVSLYLNKNGYPSVSLWKIDDGEQDDILGWKLSVDEQKALTVVTDLPNGKKDFYRGKLDELLEAEAVKLTPAGELPEPTQSRTPTLPEGKETPFGADQETEDDDDDDSLPF